MAVSLVSVILPALHAPSFTYPDITESYQLTGSLNFQQQRVKWLTTSVPLSNIKFQENPSSRSRAVRV